MAEERVTRKLAAILVADMVGYSRLMEKDEESTIARLKAYRHELIGPKIAEHDGRILKTTGDGLLIEFASVVQPVYCAVDFRAPTSGSDGDPYASRSLPADLDRDLVPCL